MGLKTVKVEYPLKQGLKRLFGIPNQIILDSVKVEYPLKQGLKPRICFSTSVSGALWLK
mgnify:CR=1 FL=1